jgi:hypothetical protein
MAADRARAAGYRHGRAAPPGTSVGAGAPTGPHGRDRGVGAGLRGSQGPRTTRRYDHSRDNLDRNAADTVAAYLAWQIFRTGYLTGDWRLFGVSMSPEHPSPRPRPHIPDWRNNPQAFRSAPSREAQPAAPSKEVLWPSIIAALQRSTGTGTTAPATVTPRTCQPSHPLAAIEWTASARGSRERLLAGPP